MRIFIFFIKLIFFDVFNFFLFSNIKNKILKIKILLFQYIFKQKYQYLFIYIYENLLIKECSGVGAGINLLIKEFI
jgi:hypothetical protein